MVGVPKNLNGSRDLIMPFQGQFVICRLGLATTNLPTKFEVCLHPLRRYKKGYKIWKMGWFRVVWGHLRSLKIMPFDTAHTSSY